MDQVDGYWKAMYHHDECANSTDTDTPYQAFCSSTDPLISNGTVVETTAAVEVCEFALEDGECVSFAADDCTNPCRTFNPYRCGQRDS